MLMRFFCFKRKKSKGCHTRCSLLDQLQVVQNAASGVHIHLHVLQVGVQDGDQPGEHTVLQGAGRGQAGALGVGGADLGRQSGHRPKRALPCH